MAIYIIIIILVFFSMIYYLHLDGHLVVGPATDHDQREATSSA